MVCVFISVRSITYIVSFVLTEDRYAVTLVITGILLCIARTVGTAINVHGLRTERKNNGFGEVNIGRFRYQKKNQKEQWS